MEPVAVVVDQPPIGSCIFKLAQRQGDNLTFHPGFAENAIRLVDHWLIIGISKANNLDPSGAQELITMASRSGLAENTSISSFWSNSAMNKFPS